MKISVLNKLFWIQIVFIGEINSQKFEKYFSLNANIFLPISNSYKKPFPIIGYSNLTQPKLIFGGQGFGFNFLNAKKEGFAIDYKFDISRNTYWDELIPMVNQQGVLIGEIASSTSEFTLGSNAILRFNINHKMRIGGGLGSRLRLFAFSRIPQINENNKVLAKMNNLKRIMPIVPLELTFKRQNLAYAVRYEQALLNHLKKEIAQFKEDKYGIIYFEVGFNFK